jgi:hypothetical protein
LRAAAASGVVIDRIAPISHTAVACSMVTLIAVCLVFALEVVDRRRLVAPVIENDGNF